MHFPEIRITNNNSLRIVVTGSHGVGKTALCEAIILELGRKSTVGFVRETARELVARGFQVNDNISNSGVHEYIEVYSENLRAANGEIILCDRCLLDLYAYTSPLYLDDGRLGPELGKEVWGLVKTDAATTDLFVYVPIEFPMQVDGVRPDEVSFQHEIDSRILDILTTLSARVLRVSGSLKDRAMAVVCEISELLELKKAAS